MVNQNREQVVQYMLKLIAAKNQKVVAKTIEAFDGVTSKSTIYNYLKELCAENVICKNGTQYELVEKTVNFSYHNDGMCSEDRMFSRDIEPLLKGFEKNVLSVWRYAFTEMMNNAIEHSKSKHIDVAVKMNAFNTTIVLADDGIGIFKNIQQYMQAKTNEELTLSECAALLFAGKFTTAENLHSGEGIFFTSHLMDEFTIVSDQVVFTRNNFVDRDFEPEQIGQGTVVTMSLNNHSKKTTRSVFDRFSDIDEGFVKTQIPIAHIFPGSGPISRSEARRLGELIGKFKEIDLDFTNVEEVGQAFCHELFVVWQNRNPDVLLNVCNPCEDVEYMIRRVKNTK